MKMAHTWNTALLWFFCAIGLILAIYSYYVEFKAAHEDEYEAMCDINEHISCSRAFTSEYGTGFGVLKYIVGEDSILNQPNSIYGTAFYIVHMIAGLFTSRPLAQLQVLVTSVANMFSVYLAYVLVFVLQDFCIVCVTTYLINFLILLTTIRRLRAISAADSKKRR